MPAEREMFVSPSEGDRKGPFVHNRVANSSCNDEISKREELPMSDQEDSRCNHVHVFFLSGCHTFAPRSKASGSKYLSLSEAQWDTRFEFPRRAELPTKAEAHAVPSLYKDMAAEAPQNQLYCLL